MEQWATHGRLAKGMPTLPAEKMKPEFEQPITN